MSLCRHILPALLCVVAAGWASGCAVTQEIRETTIVKEVTLESLTPDLPVHVVTPNSRGRLTFTMHGGYQGGPSLEGSVKGSPPGTAAWIYPVDTMWDAQGRPLLRRVVPKHNLFWKGPDFTGAVQLDYAGEVWGISAGVKFARVGGEAMVGWSAGLAVMDRRNARYAIRLDAGILGHAVSYDASTVVVRTVTVTGPFSRSSTTDTTYYRDRETRTDIGIYGAVTFNSKNQSWPVNFFFQGSVVSYPFFDYTPSRRTQTDFVFPSPILFPVQVSESTSSEVSQKILLFGVTPGIFIEPSSQMQILAGARIALDGSNTFSGSRTQVVPFLQLSYRLFGGE